MISQQSTTTGDESQKHKNRGMNRAQVTDRMAASIIYDKVRYPVYKDNIYRKKDQRTLPLEVSSIPNLVGIGGPIEMGGLQDPVTKINPGKSIVFDNDFECGNIDSVRQRSSN